MGRSKAPIRHICMPRCWIGQWLRQGKAGCFWSKANSLQRYRNAIPTFLYLLREKDWGLHEDPLNAFALQRTRLDHAIHGHLGYLQVGTLIDRVQALRDAINAVPLPMFSINLLVVEKPWRKNLHWHLCYLCYRDGIVDYRVHLQPSFYNMLKLKRHMVAKCLLYQWLPAITEVVPICLDRRDGRVNK